jgi:hypothetical protein
MLKADMPAKTKEACQYQIKPPNTNVTSPPVTTDIWKSPPSIPLILAGDISATYTCMYKQEKENSK